MNKISIVLTLVTFLINFSDAYSAEKNDKQIGVSSKTAISKFNKKNWKPLPFILDSTYLPTNYNGNDPAKFLKLIGSKIPKLYKDDLETKDEYANRMLKKEALIYPINFTDNYAFPMEMINFQYNAENQVYEVDSGYLCNPQIDYSDKGIMGCTISDISWDENTYTGSNAYGASIQVRRVQRNQFAIATIESSNFVNQMFVKSENGKFKYRDNFPLEIEKARKLKKFSIKAIVVGKVTDAKIYDYVASISSPTFDFPHEMIQRAQAVPIEPNKVIYYVGETGEILGEKSF